MSLNKENAGKKSPLFYLWLIALMGLLIVTINQLRQPQIIVTWATESEIDNIGFNLYRASSIDGELAKINEQIIPPAPDPISGEDYEFVDEDVSWLKTYYYTLESIDRDGTTERTAAISLRAKFGAIFP